MRPLDALHEVRKDLVAAFGESLANQLIETAGTLSPGEEPDAASFRELVATLCKDARVQGLFGELGVRDKLSHWEKLV